MQKGSEKRIVFADELKRMIDGKRQGLFDANGKAIVFDDDECNILLAQLNTIKK